MKTKLLKQLRREASDFISNLIVPPVDREEFMRYYNGYRDSRIAELKRLRK